MKELFKIVIGLFFEKNSNGQLQGLILNWRCGHCDKLNLEPIVRSEATLGEKNSICPNCNEKSYIKFSPSKMISKREKIVQEALPFIPLDKHKEILEDLAWIEGLDAIGGSESVAESYWDNLQKEINYLVQQDQFKLRKKDYNFNSIKK